MKIDRHRLAWQRHPLAPAHIKSWLKDTSSLTARLQAKYADFSVLPLKTAYARAHADECYMLDLAYSCLITTREVLLLGGGQPVVYAHSLLLQPSARGAWSGLKQLGKQPLGAQLFANPRVKRGCLSFKKLSRKHPLAIKASLYANQSAVWARRSRFQLGRAEILVTEVMLAALFLQCENKHESTI